MQTAKADAFVSLPLVQAVGTDADTESPVSQQDDHDERVRQAWQELIDRKLIEWGRGHSEFSDEDIEPPSSEIIGRAIDLAQRFRDDGLAPPDSVVPDANGGIVFERHENDVSEVFHVWDDLTIEYYCFHATKLVERHAL